MKNLKNYLFALIFSLIGGVTSITGYEFLKDDNNSSSSNYNENIKFANYIFDTTDVVVPVSYTHLTLPTKA